MIIVLRPYAHTKENQKKCGENDSDKERKIE